MASCSLFASFLTILFFILNFSIGAELSFNQNYHITWGREHVHFDEEQKGEIQLSLDQFSGAGFESNQSYGSGFFHMKMKLPAKNSTGVVTAYYLTSHTNNHDELDFEFLGNNGSPYSLQTNVFVNGKGDREQRIHLWFDPTKHFHSYQLLWNQYQIVFYVDNIPIRVFKNLSTIGVPYPSQPMKIEGSIWNGEGWASNGTKIDWNQAPFKACFEGFDIDGCTFNISQECYSSNLWWNEEKYSKLNITDQKNYESVTKKYMYYDYCFDKLRNPTIPPECQNLDQLD